MNRQTRLDVALKWATAVLVLVVLIRFPLFHIVPLKTVSAENLAQTFNATAFAEKFWKEKLIPAAGKATEAGILLGAIQNNPASAKTKYSHSLGLSDSYIYFLCGTGTVVSVADDTIAIAISAGITNAEIVLQIGPVFGNTVRDGCGLLNASDYPNSQDFNDISAAVNHIIEARVLPKLQTAKPGGKVSFAGCAEVDDESTDLKPLKVIPVQADVQ